jgi:hypothetical protein
MDALTETFRIVRHQFETRRVKLGLSKSPLSFVPKKKM